MVSAVILGTGLGRRFFSSLFCPYYMDMRDYFCGWYFRCQSEKQTLAVIPAIHMSGRRRSASIQLISDTGSWNVDLPWEHAEMQTGRPRAVLGGSRFREDGLQLALRADGVSASGELRFGAPAPIRYDIMGPFCCVPFMECRHSVFSMRHSVNGQLRINGTEYDFSDGVGYIEGDRGRSFPKRYAWTQCSFDGGALMLSAADIPLGPLRFTGIIGVIQLRGREYRLATYLGARAVKLGGGELVIRQGGLTLSAALLDRDARLLRAPASGVMTRLIRENVACRARYRLSEGGRTLLSLESDRAAFEYEY